MKAICTYCGSANVTSSLECIKCGAPLTDETDIFVSPSNGDEIPVEVSDFEKKVGGAIGKWWKQIVEYRHLSVGGYICFDVPRAGILTHLEIEFDQDYNPHEWWIKLLSNAMNLIESRSSKGGKIEKIHCVLDTELIPNLRLEMQNENDKKGHDIRIKVTRWIPTTYGSY